MNILKTAFLCFCFSHSMEETKHTSNNDEMNGLKTKGERIWLRNRHKQHTPKDSTPESSTPESSTPESSTPESSTHEQQPLTLKNVIIILVFWLTIIVLLLHYFGLIDFFGWFNKINFLNNFWGDKKSDGVIGTRVIGTIYTEEEISYLPIMMGAGTAALIGGIGGGACAYYFWPEEKVVKKGWF